MGGEGSGRVMRWEGRGGEWESDKVGGEGRGGEWESAEVGGERRGSGVRRLRTCLVLSGLCSAGF